MRNIRVELFRILLVACISHYAFRNLRRPRHHHRHHRTFMMRLLQKGHRRITESTLSKISE